MTSCVYWIPGVQCWYAPSTLIIPVSRAAVISKIIASSLGITGSTWNSGFPWKWWIVRAQAGSLCTRKSGVGCTRKENARVRFIKKSLSSLLFSPRGKRRPPNRRSYENPGPGLLLPLVRTLHLSCRRRGRFVPLPETVFQYGRKSKYDWTTGFTILSFTRHAS